MNKNIVTAIVSFFCGLAAAAIIAAVGNKLVTATHNGSIIENKVIGEVAGLILLESLNTVMFEMTDGTTHMVEYSGDAVIDGAEGVVKDKEFDNDRSYAGWVMTNITVGDEHIVVLQREVGNFQKLVAFKGAKLTTVVDEDLIKAMEG